MIKASDLPQDEVIKYQGEISGTSAFAGFGFLEYWRSQLFVHNLIGQYTNGIGFGNVSMQGENYSFYITASQTGHLAELQESDYVQVLAYTMATHSLKIQGSQLPSSEAPTHSAIYALDHRIKAVFHIHSAPIWRRLLSQNHLATHANVEYGTPAAEIARIYQDIADVFAHNLFGRSWGWYFGLRSKSRTGRLGNFRCICRDEAPWLNGW